MPLVGFQVSPPVHGPGRSAGAGGGAGTRAGGRAAAPRLRSSLASQGRFPFRKGRRASSSHKTGIGPAALALGLVILALMAPPEVSAQTTSAHATGTQAISGGGASHRLGVARLGVARLGVARLDVARLGVEGVSCATWLDWRRKDGAIKLFFAPIDAGTTAPARLPGWDELSRGAWKLGYGKDPSAHDDANIVDEVFRAGLNAWIDGYCRRHRRHDLSRAAGGLARHLSRQR